MAAVTVVLAGRMDGDDVVELDRHVRGLLEARALATLVCDVGTLAGADMQTVDALARLHLHAQQRGCELRLQRIPDELRELLVLTGLQGLVLGAVSGRGVFGQAEEREETRGVEEGVDPGDPAG